MIVSKKIFGTAGEPRRRQLPATPRQPSALQLGRLESVPAICVTASPGHSPRFEGGMPTNFPRLEPSPSHVSANTWRLRSDSAGSVATLVGGAPGPGAGPQLGVSPSRAAHTRYGLV